MKVYEDGEYNNSIKFIKRTHDSGVSTDTQYDKRKIKMAKPAFIYAFDNLGPDRFTELCGVLLASRYKGFLLGGVGADGGVDGELDRYYGSWQPEASSPLLNEIITPDYLTLSRMGRGLTLIYAENAEKLNKKSVFICVHPRFPRPESNV